MRATFPSGKQRDQLMVKSFLETFNRELPWTFKPQKSTLKYEPASQDHVMECRRLSVKILSLLRLEIENEGGRGRKDKPV